MLTKHMHTHIKNLFIPHKGNNFRPNFLERLSVGILLLLVFSSFAFANIQALLWIGSDFLVSTVLPAVVIDHTNKARGAETLGVLRRNIVLDAAATRKAEHMAENEYFAHYSPDGISPWYWFDQVSYKFLHAGENLAVHFTDSSEVVNAWMDSPSHKANILNKNYTEIGVGTAKGTYKGFPTIYVVQFFGTPQIDTLSLLTNEDVSSLEITREIVGDEPVAVAQASLETISVNTTPEVDVFVNAVEEPEITIDNISIGEEYTVVYSDLATSSYGAIPATIEETGSDDMLTSRESSSFFSTASQSSLWLQIIYGVLGIVVIFALILSIVIEWRRQHPIHIAYAGGLLATMALLFFVHTTLTGGVTII